MSSISPLLPLLRKQRQNHVAPIQNTKSDWIIKRRANNLHLVVLWVRDGRSRRRNFPTMSTMFTATAMQKKTMEHNRRRNTWNSSTTDHRWYSMQIIRWVDWRWEHVSQYLHRYRSYGSISVFCMYCTHAAYELLATQLVVMARCSQSHLQWQGHGGGCLSRYHGTSGQHWSAIAVCHCFDGLRPAYKYSTSLYTPQCLSQGWI